MSAEPAQRLFEVLGVGLASPHFFGDHDGVEVRQQAGVLDHAQRGRCVSEVGADAGLAALAKVTCLGAIVFACFGGIVFEFS